MPQNFENIFSKYGAIYTFPPSPDPSLNDSPSMSECLRPRNLAALHKGDRNVMDLFGWAAAAFELFASWWISDGAIRKDDMRGIYDVGHFTIIY